MLLNINPSFLKQKHMNRLKRSPTDINLQILSDYSPYIHQCFKTWHTRPKHCRHLTGKLMFFSADTTAYPNGIDCSVVPRTIKWNQAKTYACIHHDRRQGCFNTALVQSSMKSQPSKTEACVRIPYQDVNKPQLVFTTIQNRGLRHWLPLKQES
jgi:hypothetical protein